MREYEVTITKTLEMTVTVETESREEAQQIASDDWKNGGYILGADHFKDMTFRTKGRNRDRGERWDFFLAVKDSPQGNGVCMYQQASPFRDKRQLIRGSAP